MCTHTRQVENQRLHQNLQSSEKYKILRKNTIFNEHPVSEKHHQWGVQGCVLVFNSQSPFPDNFKVIFNHISKLYSRPYSTFFKHIFNLHSLLRCNLRIINLRFQAQQQRGDQICSIEKTHARGTFFSKFDGNEISKPDIQERFSTVYSKKVSLIHERFYASIAQ